jgi:hypothetical protein
MATKLPAAPADDASAVADELAVLHPDRTLTLGARTITIREYGFFEGLDIADRGSAFIADLIAASEDGTLRYAQVRRLFGRHRGIVPVIAAQAGDVEVRWLETLTADEQELYLATWFATNAAFFVREVLAELREDRLHDAQVLAAGTSAGANSSSASPPPDSVHPSSLADAPSAS